ncbi:hypothetical protein PENSPDRAFT_335862 [Peniophora sp. CONT]|nr:hypothetical protein PENSPDRAFT_335862 [Peniophora sp. CONT]
MNKVKHRPTNPGEGITTTNTAGGIRSTVRPDKHTMVQGKKQQEIKGNEEGISILGTKAQISQTT